MFKIVEAKPLDNFRVWLRFADGVTGEVDLSHLRGQGVFALWDIAGEFERVAIGPRGELVWAEEIDLCPDALYMRVTGKTPEELFPAISEPLEHARA
jgi:hypothetical protein